MIERRKIATERYPDCDDCRKANADGGHGYVLCSKHYYEEYPLKLYTQADMDKSLHECQAAIINVAVSHRPLVQTNCGLNCSCGWQISPSSSRPASFEFVEHLREALSTTDIQAARKEILKEGYLEGYADGEANDEELQRLISKCEKLQEAADLQTVAFAEQVKKIFDHAFENRWTVQGTIDAINALPRNQVILARFEAQVRLPLEARIAALEAAMSPEDVAKVDAELRLKAGEVK